MEKNILKICTSTWHQDAHDLYDYECQNCSKFSFTSSSNTSILRSGSEVSFDSITKSPNPNEIARIIKSEVFQVQKSPNIDLWLVVKSLNQGYDLQNEDTLKLGRVKYRSLILDLSLPFDYPWKFEENLSTVDCRICLSSESSLDNPLISACGCSGSIQKTHLECLSKWIKPKLTKRIIGDKLICMWRNVDCEICKTPFKVFKHLLDLNSQFNTKEPVLMIENIDEVKPGNRNIWAIQMADNESIVIGRAFECDVRINDISVSRNHAIIEKCRGSFVVKEKKSKFGTLVKINNCEVFENVQVQAGRTLLSFSFAEPVQLLE